MGEGKTLKYITKMYLNNGYMTTNKSILTFFFQPKTMTKKKELCNKCTFIHNFFFIYFGTLFHFISFLFQIPIVFFYFKLEQLGLK